MNFAPVDGDDLLEDEVDGPVDGLEQDQRQALEELDALLVEIEDPRLGPVVELVCRTGRLWMGSEAR
ncbi:MAG: hypothetical protein MZU95_13000 [Desulfomicrobium escambiense]|nr:hypothetical protein [Desulfomicrobium escambiense]